MMRSLSNVSLSLPFTRPSFHVPLQLSITASSSSGSLQCVSEISKDFLSSSLLFTRPVPSSFAVSLVLPLITHCSLFTVENSTSLQTIPLLVFLSTSFLSSLAGLSYSRVSLLHSLYSVKFLYWVCGICKDLLSPSPLPSTGRIRRPIAYQLFLSYIFTALTD